MNHFSFGKHISSIYRHQNIVVNHLLKDLNISSGQYLFLITVTEHPGLTQKSISESVHIDRANTNRALKKLETVGYITSVTDENDRRIKRSYVTVPGKEVYTELILRLKGISEILIKGLSDTNLSALESALISMEHNIQSSVNQLKEQEHDN